MLDPKYCYLLSQVRTKPSKPQPIVQKPCTTTEDDKPISMADAFASFTPLTYISNKFN
jgi:hypothetical protein